ncbi:OmpR family two-component system response regulator YxdJ [Baia soyae]|uniref:OmpR family two-component system response regulator YxdJ n=2 Tax=Baia soyae TaxID=1544746 RepID=A0A4R2S2L2_9BACL|nr:OmpR family two-component system response regulator YxdJ [Baia soyae]
MMYKIMVVEDDPKIAQLLQDHLTRYEFQVEIATQFNQITEEFMRMQPHLVLMDLNLPSFDGFYWCRQIRQTSKCPILFISAREGSMEQVMALENGADDYITKPFHYEIVLAKIRSALRRAYGTYANQGERTVEVEGLVLYPERMLLTLKDQSVELSQKEAILIEALMEKKMRVVSRDQLLDRLWNDQHFIDDNTLNVYVTRVRKKFRDLGIQEAVETVRGSGYMLKVTWSKEA